MLVDILCGIMSGSNYGPNIRHWNNYVGQVANLGHFFVAIDPDYFAPDFKDRLQVNHVFLTFPHEQFFLLSQNFCIGTCQETENETFGLT